ncbi:hypothetical protein BRC94_06445 [Halobacteriales archaeon QS_5_70_17]|nr:MAG: hypothetical protein BRC94_06445 [Halobacteriales archaeon QS_5_70_17]
MIESIAAGTERIDPGRWLTGAVAGAIGAVAGSLVLFAAGAFEVSELSVEVLGVLFVPGAAFGLVYAGIAGVDRIASLAADPRTGGAVGIAYGVLFWATTLTGGPATAGGLLSGLAFGGTIGVLYARSPFVG